MLNTQIATHTVFKCAYQSIDIDLPRKTNSKKVRQANPARYLRYIQFTLGAYSMYFAGFLAEISHLTTKFIPRHVY